MPVLADIFSAGNTLKRRMKDFGADPGAFLETEVNYRNQKAGEFNTLQDLATQGDINKMRGLPVTQEQQAAEMRLRDIVAGAYNPVGSMNIIGLPNRGKEFIQSSAEDLASQLQKLGFQAEVTHSGSVAGPSSYVKIYDPETGRLFNKPVRFSGHSKGSFNQAEVRDVSDPNHDLPKIIEDALAMRGQGPSRLFQYQAQKQAIADELIAGGMKPRQAYAQADKRLKAEQPKFTEQDFDPLMRYLGYK
jgi:hypothetical protein